MQRRASRRPRIMEASANGSTTRTPSQTGCARRASEAPAPAIALRGTCQSAVLPGDRRCRRCARRACLGANEPAACNGNNFRKSSRRPPDFALSRAAVGASGKSPCSARPEFRSARAARRGAPLSAPAQSSSDQSDSAGSRWQPAERRTFQRAAAAVCDARRAGRRGSFDADRSGRDPANVRRQPACKRIVG